MLYVYMLLLLLLIKLIIIILITVTVIMINTITVYYHYCYYHYYYYYYHYNHPELVGRLAVVLERPVEEHAPDAHDAEACPDTKVKYYSGIVLSYHSIDYSTVI